MNKPLGVKITKNIHVILFLNKNNCLGVVWMFIFGLNFAIKNPSKILFRSNFWRAQVHSPLERVIGAWNFQRLFWSFSNVQRKKVPYCWYRRSINKKDDLKIVVIITPTWWNDTSLAGLEKRQKERFFFFHFIHFYLCRITRSKVWNLSKAVSIAQDNLITSNS